MEMKNWFRILHRTYERVDAETAYYLNLNLITDLYAAMIIPSHYDYIELKLENKRIYWEVIE